MLITRPKDKPRILGQQFLIPSFTDWKHRFSQKCLAGGIFDYKLIFFWCFHPQEVLLYCFHMSKKPKKGGTQNVCIFDKICKMKSSGKLKKWDRTDRSSCLPRTHSTNWTNESTQPQKGELISSGVKQNVETRASQHLGSQRWSSTFHYEGKRAKPSLQRATEEWDTHGRVSSGEGGRQTR